MFNVFQIGFISSWIVCQRIWIRQPKKMRTKDIILMNCYCIIMKRNQSWQSDSKKVRTSILHAPTYLFLKLKMLWISAQLGIVFKYKLPWHFQCKKDQLIMHICKNSTSLKYFFRTRLHLLFNLPSDYNVCFNVDRNIDINFIVIEVSGQFRIWAVDLNI